MSIKMIAPRRLPVARLENAIYRALEQGAQLAKDRQARFTQTWSNEPDWEEVGPMQRGDDLIWRRITSSTPYIFVEEGTRVRYATMTSDFQAKTQPYVLQSGVGQGGVLYVDTRRPRPGIKARKSNLVIVTEVQKRLGPIMRVRTREAFGGR